MDREGERNSVSRLGYLSLTVHSGLAVQMADSEATSKTAQKEAP
jgi:hypothetical protein